MKILICAYACNPYLGSEAGVGWGWSLIAARSHEVWVITDEIHRGDIERYLAENPNRNLHFCYIRKTPFFRFTEAHFRLLPLLAWRAYFCWQHDAYQRGMRLHREIGFDLVHNLTYVGFRAPGEWYRSGIPFVWGPLGGLEQTNLRLAWALGFKCFFWFFCRNILNWRDKVFSLRVRRGMRAAAGGIISATSGIQREIRNYHGQESTVISEIGMELPEREDFVPFPRKPDEPLKLIWIGRMYPGKGFAFVLKALMQLPEEINWELQSFGDGECRRKWECLADRAGLGDRIHWMGNRPRAEVIQAQKSSHALLISSIYELSCTCAIEALAAGIPAIAPDICGFPESVPDGCGIRFPARNPKEFITGLRDGIVRLYRNEAERRALCCNAKVRVREFSWERKAELLKQVYSAKLRMKNCQQ